MYIFFANVRKIDVYIINTSLLRTFAKTIHTYVCKCITLIYTSLVYKTVYVFVCIDVKIYFCYLSYQYTISISILLTTCIFFLKIVYRLYTSHII